MYQLIHLISSRKVKYGCLLGRVLARDGGKGRYAGSFSEKKIFKYILYSYVLD